MKFFKWSHDFRLLEKLTGFRVVIMISNHRHGYKKKVIKPDAKQISFLSVENIDSKL